MLRDIVLGQKREIEQRLLERYVRRDAAATSPSPDLIHVVLGPRRAGKSFLAMHVASDGGPFGYANFDDERLVALQDYDELVVALDSVHGNPGQILLDEVQNLPRWELFVNRLHREGRRLIITGSNAHLLGSELATHLTGRFTPIVLFPFSYAEFVRSLGREITDLEQLEEARRYVESGGYPETVVKQVNRHDYLSTLLRSVLYKDILVRHRIRAPQSLEDLTTYLMTNIAQEYSYNTLASATRCRSVHTVEKYVRHLEEAFLLFSVARFSFKVREQIRSNRKVYCTDNGLATSSSFRFSPDHGKLYENVVAIALRRREMEGKLRMFFWKSVQHEEVDFVVMEGLHVSRLIQVCVDVSNPKTRQREIRSLLKASAELGCLDLLVINESYEAEEQVQWHGSTGLVRYVPLWKWLLSA